MLGANLPSSVRQLGRAWHDGRAPDLHHALAVRLLLIANPHHVHHALEVEDPGGKGEGAPPLARAGLGRQSLGALGLVVKSLGDRRVRLVRTGRADPFVFVINLRSGLELPFQPGRAHQGRRPPQSQRLLHRLRDVDVAFLGDFLLDQLHREQRRQILRADRLTRARVKR